MPIVFDLKKISDDQKCETYLETGLGYCDIEDVSLKQALRCNFSKCISVEIDEKFINKGNEVFRDDIENNKCELILGDSAKLSEYLDRINGRCLFFLDAHIQGGMGDECNYVRKCPLLEELEAIKKLERKDHVICIDDMRIITTCKWGDYQNEDLLKQIKNKIKEINPEYKFERLDGHVTDDVLFAHI
tara:strand:- start:441 stop:1004 length:564 start_codon:yes stop_codon:yes gene_type:complete